MKNSNIRLQEELEKILGSKQVYFQPPENIRLKYPCIIYSFIGIKTRNANGYKYTKSYTYKINVITQDPDTDLVDKMLSFPETSLGTPFCSDRLYHYPFTINYYNEGE